MRILLVAPASGTSLHRFHALERLGHEVHLADPRPNLLDTRLGRSWTYRTGGLGSSALVSAHLRAEIGSRRYDIAFVDGGELLGPEHVAWMKSVARTVVNFNQDNPYVGAEGRKWRRFLRAVPDYDLIVTPRASSAAAARELGAKRVMEVTFAADEVVHRPPQPRPGRDLDVVFAGTWMPGRGPLLVRLLELGVPLRIFGPRWSKAPDYPALAPAVTEGFLGDREYVDTIARAKIGLAVLFKGNRDLHTTRSLEIPAIGTLLCAERTADHAAMYRDGEEAVLWDSAEECAALCLDLLRDEPRLERIARAGHARANRNGCFNEQVLARVLSEAAAA
jgi:spore maturation protein CgeB